MPGTIQTRLLRIKSETHKSLIHAFFQQHAQRNCHRMAYRTDFTSGTMVGPAHVGCVVNGVVNYYTI